MTIPSPLSRAGNTMYVETQEKTQSDRWRDLQGRGHLHQHYHCPLYSTHVYLDKIH